MSLQILVYLNKESFRNGKPCFQRLVDLDPSIVVPYHSLASDLKFLYGSSCVVSFDLL